MKTVNQYIEGSTATFANIVGNIANDHVVRAFALAWKYTTAEQSSRIIVACRYCASFRDTINLSKIDAENLVRKWIFEEQNFDDNLSYFENLDDRAEFRKAFNFASSLDDKGKIALAVDSYLADVA